MKKIINSAKKTLEDGNLVIFPTETVYGLGGDATNDSAIKKIYYIKKRPTNNPLICHFANISKINENFELNSLEKKLANKFWPGPMTLILKKKKNCKISKILSNNLDFVGCRIPDNLIAMELLKILNFPLAAPSANLATKTSVTRVEDLDSELIKNALIIKGEKTKFGLESTVIKVKNKKINILRLGSITEEEIINYFPKNKIINSNTDINLSPGNQKKHYSPNLPIRINVNSVKKGEGLLNFGKNNLKSKICEYNLSLNSNLEEAANNFFHFLNLLDKSNCKKIAVAPIPLNQLGKTINDRLKRAVENDK
jgi:L-threonylcarbamoyladenylate synthase